jgi:enoyl-[acyl-carrier protein] reductase I
MGLLDGKIGIIYGVRNERSLAWGCAKSIVREGAKLVLAVYSDRELKEAEKLTETLTPSNNTVLKLCDLTDDGQVEELHKFIAGEYGKLDFAIHAVANAKREDLAGRYVDTSRDGFLFALERSSFSFNAVTRAAEPLMKNGGSIITLTYLGSEKVVPNYNLMGIAKAALESSVRYLANDLGPQNIRVNAISPGPTMTLAAKGISNFTSMYKDVPERAPLRRNTTIEEVGDTAAFMVSDWSRGITGETIYVDNGMHILAG